MRKISTVGTLAVLVLLLAFASCALPNMPEFTASGRVALSAPAVAAGTAGDEESTTESTGRPTGNAGDGSVDGTVVAYRHAEDSITLEWDAAPGAVTSYRVYVRERPDGPWTLLDEIAATGTPSYEVGRSATGDGSFDFAVSSVDTDGTESVKHTSLDNEADPPSGWYVIWESSP